MHRGTSRHMNAATNKRVSISSIGAEENKMDTSKHDFPEPHKEDSLVLKPRAQEDEGEDELKLAISREAVLSPAEDEQQGGEGYERKITNSFEHDEAKQQQEELSGGGGWQQQEQQQNVNAQLLPEVSPATPYKPSYATLADVAAAAASSDSKEEYSPITTSQSNNPYHQGGYAQQQQQQQIHASMQQQHHPMMSLGSHLSQQEGDTNLPTSTVATAAAAGGITRRDSTGDATTGSATDQKQSFLYSLYDILSNPEYETISGWLPHGRGFIINNKPRFEKEILPLFLPSTKYASFTRRLKRWKFVRVSSGIEMGSYYHPNFQRGKPNRIHLVNTVDSPLADALMPTFSGFPIPGASSSATSTSSLRKSMGRQKQFADIRLPYSNFGPPSGQQGDETNVSSSTNSRAVTHLDVRDFPQIMREISKTKRQDAHSKRRKSHDDYSPGGDYPSTSPGSMEFDSKPPLSYPPNTSMPLPHSAGMMDRMSGLERMPGMGMDESAMMPQYSASNPFSQSFFDHHSNPSMMQRQRDMAAAWESRGASSMMGSGFGGDSLGASGAATASSANMHARLPPSPGPTPPLEGSLGISGMMAPEDRLAALQSYRQQAAMMYGDSAARDQLFGGSMSEWMMRQQYQQEMRQQQQQQQQQHQQQDMSSSGMHRYDWEDYAFASQGRERERREED